ncbi:hypothetical protein COCSADRAFT_40741 [Bipolaris sorokiniana ND90Pr]|uniref:Uncharacterized protein n=1 Tax=Cochliobolus sativus (strain ND90Pr / ATCC 201652) TaxID=665912 RepID=M2RWU8_COCSN|nr:uncharacterized protein COCSADRAFT_40741 [Bipolaris sorokiniana ND90Pr]EMD59548.1 hypothetical protein COCSADRAFT_40741 [Bipolaris sorokiniana ND90Pr]
MSTTLVTSRTRQSTTTPTSTRSIATSSTSSTPRPRPTSSTTTTPTTSSSPKSTSQSNLASELATSQLETDDRSTSPTEASLQSNSPYTNTPAIATCSMNSDCAYDKICSNERCVTMDSAAPFGGADSTSRLTTGSAIGMGTGLVALLMLLTGITVWILKRRAQRPRNQSVEAPIQSRSRTTSDATDQKTLVASMPNSPQYPAFNSQSAMNPGLFTRVIAPQETKEVASSRHGSMDRKALPLLPLPQLPLPPIPKETKVYALNVSINKSMIMDEDMMQAVSPMRGNDTPRGGATQRDRAPRYKFEEYIPPVANAPPPIAISRAPAPGLQSSEYELGQYPKKEQQSEAVPLSDGGPNGGLEPLSPVVETFTSSDSKARQLSLPDLPPPSPSFSFRSYDWYQDIIEEPSNGNGARTPTQAKFPKMLSLFPQSTTRNMDLGVLPEPSSPGASSIASGTHLHPSSAAMLSPTSPNFRLSPTVYTPPPRQLSQSQQHIQKQKTQTKSSSRISAVSTASHKTRESRSWLPAEGLYLADEGGLTRYLTFRRGNEDNRPTSYSPLA